MNWLEPVVGSRPPRTAPGCTAATSSTPARAGRWSASALAWVRCTAAAPVPAVAPRGSLLTLAARKDLYGDAFNESVLMRPGQYLTRLSVYFDNRGSTALVNGLAAAVGGTSGPAAQAADRLRPLLRAVHVRRRGRAGRRAPAMR